MPSELVQFLSLDEVKAIHERLIQRFGGESGIRDEGMLQSALYRPQSGYYETLPEMAAALFESLLINHAFNDGNKRIAFFATDVFLRLNGWKVIADTQDAYLFVVERIESSETRYEKILSWIESHLVKL